MQPEYVYRAKVRRVVDGDTLDLAVDLGFKVHVHIRVRLYGINTPEKFGVKKGSPEYEAGVAASSFVEQWLNEHTVDNDVVIRSIDGKPIGQGKYGRWLVELYAESDDGTTEGILNEALVVSGHAERVTY